MSDCSASSTAASNSFAALREAVDAGQHQNGSPELQRVHSLADRRRQGRDRGRNVQAGWRFPLFRGWFSGIAALLIARIGSMRVYRCAYLSMSPTTKNIDPK